MAASLFVLGRLPGVLRPTIYAYFPRLQEEGLTNIVDVGANVDCKPENLLQFAEMLSIYQKYAAGIGKPQVGLLNIGEEEGKGSDTLKQAYSLLKEANTQGKINFLGNIEGHDILKGRATIVVCDGLVGNTILKFGESIPEFLGTLFKQALGSTVASGGMDEKTLPSQPLCSKECSNPLMLKKSAESLSSVLTASPLSATAVHHHGPSRT